MKAWLITEVANQAYRTGQGYRDGRIYRSEGRYRFKQMPYILPNWVVQLDIETHRWLEALAKHAFRAGLNSTKKDV